MPNGAPSLDVAQQVVAIAVDRARAMLLRIAVVVVDRGGHDIAVARMDGVSYVNLEPARRKARAAAGFAAPTHAMAEMMDRDALLQAAFAATSDHLLVLPGGFPLTDIATPVGGFGIAGGHYEQDREIGEHVIRTLAANIGN
jgi:glc operon protein GlcG